jgi:hypothetical protein
VIGKLTIIGFATLIILGIAGLGIFGPKAPDVNIPQSYDPPVVDMTEAETEQWMDSLRAAGYNVDVQVTAHAWDRHNTEATNAIRCLTNNGTSTILSEKGSRNLHLICIDPKTGEAWVVIIERIRRYADTLQNATSRLITAFKLTDVTVEQYITWETTVKSIVIRLSFKAGELFFKP